MLNVLSLQSNRFSARCSHSLQKQNFLFNHFGFLFACLLFCSLIAFSLQQNSTPTDVVINSCM